MSLDLVLKAFTEALEQNFVEVWQEDSGTGFSDQTGNAAVRLSEDANFDPFPSVESSPDACYFGFHLPFGKIVLSNAGGTAGTLGVVTWQYWDGSVWQALSAVSDGTNNFRAGPSQGQEVTYTVPSDWARTTVNSGASLYYVRARVDTVWTVNPVYDWAIPSDFGGSFNPVEVWQEDADGGPSYVSMLTEATDSSAGDVDPWPATEATGDAFYVGLRQQFGGIRVDYAGGTAGVGGAIAAEYWDGDSWEALSITDPTTGFTATAADDYVITWTIPGDWAKTTVNSGESLFFIRIRPSTTYSTNPVLDQLWCVRADLLLTTSYLTNSAQHGLVTSLPLEHPFTGGFQLEVADDDNPLSGFPLPRDCTLEDIISDEQHAGAVTYEVLKNGTVATSHTSASGAGDDATRGLSVSFSQGDRGAVRAVLSGGANPGKVTITLRFSHAVTVPGLILPPPPVFSPPGVDVLDHAAMHFGATGSTTARWLQANGDYGSADQSARGDLTKLRCPIDGTIDLVLVNCVGNIVDLTFWINNVEITQNLRYYNPSGDELDKFVVFREVGIAVAEGDIIEVERTDTSALNLATLLIKPDGEASGHQYWFGGDMQTTSRAMSYMGEPGDTELTIDTINAFCTVLYDGIITKVSLRRQISGTTYRLRINGVTQGEEFSADAVTELSQPIPVAAADIIQVVTTAGAGAQNRSSCCVHVVPDDASKTGVVFPYGGDTIGAPHADQLYQRNGQASDTPTTNTEGGRIVFHKDVHLRRIGGRASGGSNLNVILQAAQVALRQTAAGGGIARVEEVLPAEGGLLVPAHKPFSIATLGDQGDSGFNVYME